MTSENVSVTGSNTPTRFLVRGTKYTLMRVREIV
jgi:hypothetical protein